jgi:hypothetical protein
MDNLGFGVLLGMLGGNAETVAAVKASLGKEIRAVELRSGDSDWGEHVDQLRLTLNDGTTLCLWDGGQSCCEHRYMHSDADLPAFVGATLMDVSLAEAPTVSAEYDQDHEMQILNVHTSKGVLDVVTHNVHNGYYGGFWIQARLE